MLNLKNTLDGYLKNVEVIGNTIQDINNLADIRSVGDKVDGQELYKIDVVSNGKNLLNLPYTQNNKLVSKKNLLAEFSFKVKVGATYTFSFKQNVTGNNGSSLVWAISYDKTFNGTNKIFTTVGTVASCTFTATSEVVYFIGGVCKSNEYYDFQLEEGTQATTYEPYKGDKLEILSPVQLEKVGDVADRIICKDGVWGVEKNIKTYTVSQDTVITHHHNHENGTTSYRIENVLEQPNSTVITSKFNRISFIALFSLGDIGHASHEENTYLYVRLEGNTNIDIAKQQLQGMLIKYMTSTPQFIPLPYDQQIKLRTFAGQTNVAFLTEIAGQIKAQVPKSLGATVNTHTEQIKDLHNSLDRVKKLEETTVSTVETESSFTTVDATSNGYFEDVKLEGKTLVNLIPKYSKGSGVWSYATFESDEYGYVKANATGSWLQLPRPRKTSTNIKPGTEYTIILDIKSNTLNSVFEVSSNYSTDFIFRKTIQIDPGKSGIFTFLVKSVEDITNCIDLFRSQLFNTCTEGTIVYRYSLLEGDHTNNPPEFFEGLLSVGQDVEEVSVASVNGDGNLFDGEWAINNINSAFSKNYIPINKNRQYKIVTDYINNLSQINFKEYDIDFNYIQDSGYGYGKCESGVLTPSSNCKYIKIYADLSSKANEFIYANWKVQSIDIIDNTKYNSYKQDKKPLLYYNPTTETWEKPVLREWDTIEKHSDGKYYYHKRSEEIVLNGSESWSNVTNNSANGYRLATSALADSIFKGNLLCDKFNVINTVIPGDSTQSTFILNTMSISTYSTSLYVATQYDVPGFKAWLKANPTTVVYQLAKEEVYECTNIDLMTYSGETNYIINSGAISPKSILKVHNNISNVVKILQEKVSLLENTFIAGLKSVLSGDMYSLATILYPEDFEQNDNTEQDIMVIPE